MLFDDKGGVDRGRLRHTRSVLGKPGAFSDIRGGVNTERSGNTRGVLGRQGVVWINTGRSRITMKHKEALG